MYADRVLETSTTTGTGNFTLSGAVSKYQAFLDHFSNGDTVAYCIEHQDNDEWEVGIGSIATGSILSRTTVLASTNADAAVNFSAGTKNVFCTLPAEYKNKLQDDMRLYFGDDDDASMRWDGSALNVEASQVELSSGSLAITSSENKIFMGTSKQWLLNVANSGTSYFEIIGGGGYVFVSNNGIEVLRGSSGVREINMRNWKSGIAQLRCEGATHDLRLRTNNATNDQSIEADGDLNIVAGGTQVINANPSSLSIPQDNFKLYIGEGDDLFFEHDGTDSHIDNSTGDLKIASGGALDLVDQTVTAITTETLSDYVEVKINGVVRKLAVVS